MPVLTNPLLSIGAKKVFAKSVTFYRSRGQDLARQRVIPANPRTTAQVANRNAMTTANMCSRTIFGDLANKTAANQLAKAAGKHETWLSYGQRILRGMFGVIEADKFFGVTVEAVLDQAGTALAVRGNAFAAAVGDRTMTAKATGNPTLRVRVYDVATGNIVEEAQMTPTAGLYSHTFQADGNYPVKSYRVEFATEDTGVIVGAWQGVPVL